MRHERIAFERRWVVLSHLQLEGACERMQAEFNLPNFAVDCEIDSRWAVSEKEGAELNITHWDVSRRERLEELPSGFPDYNYLLIVTVAHECLSKQGQHWFLDESIKSLSQRIANTLGETVYYLESGWAQRPPRFMVVYPVADLGTTNGPR